MFERCMYSVHSRKHCCSSRFAAMFAAAAPSPSLFLSLCARLSHARPLCAVPLLLLLPRLRGGEDDEEREVGQISSWRATRLRHTTRMHSVSRSAAAASWLSAVFSPCYIHIHTFDYYTARVYNSLRGDDVEEDPQIMRLKAILWGWPAEARRTHTHTRTPRRKRSRLLLTWQHNAPPSAQQRAAAIYPASGGERLYTYFAIICCCYMSAAGMERKRMRERWFCVVVGLWWVECRVSIDKLYFPRGHALGRGWWSKRVMFKEGSTYLYTYL